LVIERYRQSRIGKQERLRVGLMAKGHDQAALVSLIGRLDTECLEHLGASAPTRQHSGSGFGRITVPVSQGEHPFPADFVSRPLRGKTGAELPATIPANQGLRKLREEETLAVVGWN
jgi:hypothetical protein